MAKLVYEDLEIDFERTFGIIEWSKYGISNHKGECWVVLGQIGDNVCRTYICQTKKEIQDCIRYWPTQTVYVIYEMESILQAHLMARDYREQCSFNKSIKQSLN